MPLRRSAVLITLLALTAVALASLPSRDRFVGVRFAPEDSTVTLTFALAAEDGHAAVEREFAAITDPSSPRFRQFLSQDQVLALSQPSAETLHAVAQFLKRIEAFDVELDTTGTMMFASMSVATAEREFGVRLVDYAHESAPTKIVQRRAASTEFSLPLELVGHIDTIGRLTELVPLKAPRHASPPTTKPNIVAPSQHRAGSEPARVHPVGAAQCTTPPAMLYPAVSDEVIWINVNIFCCDGSSTTDATNPCSETASPLTGIYSTLQTLETPTPAAHITHFAALADFVDTCAYNPDVDTVSCTPALNEFGQLIAYQQYAVSISAAFGSSATAYAPYYVPLVLSPFVTPQLLADYYKVELSNYNFSSAGAVVEFSGQYMSLSDLTQFLNDMDLPMPAQLVMVGPNNGTEPGDEATLDIQWMAALAPGAPLWFWSVGDGAYMLEWVGEVLGYPTPVPQVYSISYGGPENSTDPSYVLRVEVELKKFALLGLTVMVSSGDAGATDIGHGTTTCDFSPQWPASSPSVTAVSASYLTPYFTPVCYQKFDGGSAFCPTTVLGEVPTAADNGMVWTTGGGFSSVFAQPPWSVNAVNEYLKSGVMPASSNFNASGRAYPDVTAVGHNLLIVDDGVLGVADGTSASSPIMAAMAIQINAKLMSLGLPPLGLLNPLLYAAAATSNGEPLIRDITVGDNACGDVLHDPHVACCPAGFQATQGFDAVTGVGSIIWKYFADFVVSQ